MEPTPAQDRPDAPALGRNIAWATIAGLGALGLWLGFGFATDLIFHFHPAVVGLAVGSGYSRSGGMPGRRGSIVIGAVSTVLVAVGAAVLAAADRPMDSAAAIALIGAAGVAGGLVVAARPRAGR